MATLGTGLIIFFEDSAFTADVIGESWDGISRTSIEATKVGTATKRVFTPADLSDAGSFSATIAFDADKEPPVDGDAEPVRIHFPNESGSVTSWRGAGFITSFELTAPLEAKMTAALTVKITADVGIAAIVQEGEVVPLKNDDGDEVSNDDSNTVFVAA